MNKHKPDPYCAFKDDLQRYRALRSRDLRVFGTYVVMGMVVAISILYGATDRLGPLLRWLRPIL